MLDGLFNKLMRNASLIINVRSARDSFVRAISSKDLYCTSYFCVNISLQRVSLFSMDQTMLLVALI